MELREIQLLISQQQYEVGLHAQQERLEENLDIEQIEEAIVQSGNILEQYPDDPRGESCLMLGFARGRCYPRCLGVGNPQNRRHKGVAGDNRLQADTAEMD